MVTIGLAIRDGRLVVTAPALGGDIVIRDLAPDQRCAALVADSTGRRGNPVRERRLYVGCDLGKPATEVVVVKGMALEGSDLSEAVLVGDPVDAPVGNDAHVEVAALGGARVLAVGEKRAVHIDTDIAGQAACPAAPRRSLDVIAEQADVRADGQVERTARLRVPQLAWQHSWDMGPRSRGAPPLHCHSVVMRAAKRMEVECDQVESNITVAVGARQGLLVVQERAFTMDDNHPAVSLRAVVPLPCGAELRFRKVSIHDPAWAPMGECATCALADEKCQTPCLEDLADASGGMTDAGVACQSRCADRLQACESRCNH